MAVKNESTIKNAPHAGVIVDDKDRGLQLSMPETPSRKTQRGVGAAIKGKTFGKDG